MRKIILIISLILSFSPVLLADGNTLKQANNLYAKGEYSDAAKLYEKILATEGVAPELYFNLGNAYYKTNELGKSILNYERALRLSPMYEDARYNLETAQLKVVDNIARNQSFFIGKWIDLLMKLLNSNQWFWLSLILFLLCLAGAFLFIFGSSHAVRKGSFYVAAIMLGISLLTVFFAGIRKDQMINHREAIIMTGTVSVKGSPDKSGTDLFQLHEGTKVSVKSTLNNWAEIKLGNGNVGWVEQENIERI